MVQLSATMEQTRETQLAQLYDVLGFRRVIAHYDVLSTRHETGPSTITLVKSDVVRCFSRINPNKAPGLICMSPD